MDFKFRVLNRGAMQKIINDYHINRPTMIISIAEREGNNVYRQMLLEKGRLAEVDFTNLSTEDDDTPVRVLITHFDDVEQESSGAIYPEEAAELAEFILANKNILDLPKAELWVNCAAGISRSSAVTAAILKYFKNDDTPIFTNTAFTPNMRVYRYLLNALYEKGDEDPCQLSLYQTATSEMKT